MAILLLGLVLFLGVHSVRLASPTLRDRAMLRIGEGPYKGLYSLASLAGFILIIWGFARASSNAELWYVPPFWLRHITEAVTLPALILAVASLLPAGRIKRWVRHPLLIATILWSCAHLFVNGDSAGVVLFGAFLVWAVVDLIVALGRLAVAPSPPAVSGTYDIVAVVAGLALYALLVWRLHAWLFGVSPIV